MSRTQIDIPDALGPAGDVAGQAGGAHRGGPGPRPAAGPRLLPGRRLGRPRRPHRDRPEGGRRRAPRPVARVRRRRDRRGRSTRRSPTPAVAEWGGLDVWIANAGISPVVAGPARPTRRSGAQVLEVNLTGAFLGARAAARVMGDGRPDHLHRLGARRAARARASPPTARRRPGWSGMAKGLALDLAPAGITVNVVAPGWFDSPLAEGWKNSPRARGRDPRPHRAAAVGRRHRSRRRLSVPGLGRVGLRHRHGPQRRRGVPAGMTPPGRRDHRRGRHARRGAVAPASRASPTPTWC